MIVLRCVMKKPGPYVSTCDDNDPRFMFSTTHTALLSAILNGQVDPMELVRREMANRGLNKDGLWVGFKRAEELLK